MRFFIHTMRNFTGWFCAILLAWCATAAPADSAAPATPEKTKPCFQCNGTGKAKCPERTCQHGQIDCPAPCLKPNVGVWEHMEVAGHSPDELWQKFKNADDHGWQAWNQHHYGEVIEMHEGKPVNVGKCKVCGGTMFIPCSFCKGSGYVPCSLCEGRQSIPESWTAMDNPKLKSRPVRFELKDGRVLIGRKTIVVGNFVTIRTEKGNVEIDGRNIVTEDNKPPKK